MNDVKVGLIALVVVVSVLVVSVTWYAVVDAHSTNHVRLQHVRACMTIQDEGFRTVCLDHA